jgi:polyhydroxyalkanoate synthesis regulator phasin
MGLEEKNHAELKSLIESVNQNLAIRFDNLEENFENVKLEVGSLTTRMNKVESDYEKVRLENVHLYSRINDLERQIAYMSDESRRKNLIVGGIVGGSDDSNEQCIAKVRKQLSPENNEDVKTSDAYRIKNAKSAIKPMVMKFADINSKQIFRQAGRLTAPPTVKLTALKSLNDIRIS